MYVCMRMKLLFLFIEWQNSFIFTQLGYICICRKSVLSILNLSLLTDAKTSCAKRVNKIWRRVCTYIFVCFDLTQKNNLCKLNFIHDMTKATAERDDDDGVYFASFLHTILSTIPQLWVSMYVFLPNFTSMWMNM